MREVSAQYARHSESAELGACGPKNSAEPRALSISARSRISYTYANRGGAPDPVKGAHSVAPEGQKPRGPGKTTIGALLVLLVVIPTFPVIFSLQKVRKKGRKRLTVESSGSGVAYCLG